MEICRSIKAEIDTMESDENVKDDISGDSDS